MIADPRSNAENEQIVLGGGCFWCVEAVLIELRGVISAVSGYAGGITANPTYEQVCGGGTGHAEVVQVEFDPNLLPLHDLLTIFMTIHDPTTLNRQGADVGTQYRSVIFYQSSEQEQVARAVVREVESLRVWRGIIVTEITPLTSYYPAEDYHQHYYRRNPNQGYCQMVIEPKVAKFRALYGDRLRGSAVRPG